MSGLPGTTTPRAVFRLALIVMAIALGATSCATLGLPDLARDGAEQESEAGQNDPAETGGERATGEGGAEGQESGTDIARGEDTAGTADQGSQRDEDAAAQVPVRVLAQGLQSAIRVPVVRAVSDEATYREFWDAISANDVTRPEAPEVDFGAEQVVVVLMGERPTAGYAVNIVSVVEVRRAVEVEIDLIQPVPGAVVAQVLTAPYLVAAIPYPTATVVFTGESPELGFQGD